MYFLMNDGNALLYRLRLELFLWQPLLTINLGFVCVLG